MLGDGGHAARALVAGVAVFLVLAVRVGEATGPLLGYAGGDPAFDHLFKAVGADGEELGAVVEDAVVYEIRPHAAADFFFLFEDRDAPARVLEGAGGDEAGEAGAYYDAELHATTSSFQLVRGVSRSGPVRCRSASRGRSYVRLLGCSVGSVGSQENEGEGYVCSSTFTASFHSLRLRAAPSSDASMLAALSMVWKW